MGSNRLLWFSGNDFLPIIHIKSLSSSLSLYIYCVNPYRSRSHIEGCEGPRQNGTCKIMNLTFPRILGWCVPSALIVCSAPGGHLERHRSIAGKCSEQPGPEHRTQCGPLGGCAVHHFLPAQQTDANHSPNPGGAVHQPPAKLPAGGLWPVSSLFGYLFLSTCLVSPSSCPSWSFFQIIFCK